MTAQTFGCIEEYAEALGYQNLRLTPLARATEAWGMSIFDLDGVALRWARDGGASLGECAIPTDGIGFMTCIDSIGRMSGNGVMMGPTGVFVIPARTAIECVGFGPITWASVYIPTTRWPPQLAAARHTCGVLAQSVDVSPFRQTLTRVVAAALAREFDANPLGRREAASQLVAGITSLLCTTPPSYAPESNGRGRPRIPRAWIVQCVREQLEASPRRRVSISELAQHMGISRRTLHNAFREQLGVSARRFLRVHTLNVVRTELRRPDAQFDGVTGVLSRLGIWEWGRFARDYRSLFGELPSETLRGCVDRDH